MLLSITITHYYIFPFIYSIIILTYVRKDTFKLLKYRLYLIITALIWGTTFVFQRIGSGTIGTFAFITIRFLIGSIAILPLFFYTQKHLSEKERQAVASAPIPLWLTGLILGSLLFAGASLQQESLLYTTAGKAGFISSLYIIAVPLVGVFLKTPIRINHIIGCLLSVIGIYYLAFPSGSGNFNIGDLMNLTGVLFWTCQILCVDYFIRWYPGIYLAELQFVFSAIWGALFLYFSAETCTSAMVNATLIPLLYAGIMSSGIAFTLQILGQRKVPPTEASLLLSCEMIFGALAGYLFLGEIMDGREILGCILMSSGIFMSQINGRILWPPERIRSK